MNHEASPDAPSRRNRDATLVANAENKSNINQEELRAVTESGWLMLTEALILPLDSFLVCLRRISLPIKLRQCNI